MLEESEGFQLTSQQLYINRSTDYRLQVLTQNMSTRPDGVDYKKEEDELMAAWV